MCYMIYLSTTCPEDLGLLPSNIYRFQRLTTENDPVITDQLDYPFRWRLEGRYGGCSCHFRHLGGELLEFAPPADWLPEDADDIEATKAVYDVLGRMLADGHKVDLVDVWSNDQPD